jgi:predicted NUDIX family NTP pyrophosphohydrolase
MAKRSRISAGLMMYRLREGRLEVFLVHPGGPFFADRDAGAWSVPKGEVEDGELLDTAVREFAEETGKQPSPPYVALGAIKQRGGKTVHAWAFAGDWEAGRVLVSNTFEMEWPRKSGQLQTFPEVDRGEFFAADVAREKINVAQAELVDRLAAHLGLA